MLRIYLSEICEAVSIERADIDADVRDAGDIHVIAAATEGRCDFIITGDKDLLELEEYKEVYIISPSDFLKLADVA